jgi:hypothetical protein
MWDNTNNNNNKQMNDHYIIGNMMAYGHYLNQ